MKLAEIIARFEETFPKKYAYEWDNVGLLCGDAQQEVKRVFVTLDVTRKTLQEAILQKADCIFSHHPLIFSGLKKITTDSVIGELLLLAIQNGISIYAAHTNLDVAPKGINAVLAEAFSLCDVSFIEPNPEFAEAGLGVIGTVEPVSLTDFCNRVKSVLNTPFVRVCGNGGAIISRVAIGSGSCSDLASAAKRMGADVILTGDFKYHDALDSVQEEIAIIDAGHFPTEEISKKIIADCLKPLGLEIVYSSQKDVFSVL